MFIGIFIVCIAILLVGYKFYGDFMTRVYGINNDNETPATRLGDGMDYVPTHPAVLLGHHFSSIAGAGPITGPILASGIFGWLPTLIWCMIGCIFIGGPHDYGALVASVRHDGQSVGVVVDRWIGSTGKKLFLSFTVLTLILVVAVFVAMTAGTFAADPVVAFVSCLYVVLAIISGLLIYHAHVNFKAITIVMLIVIACAAVFGDNLSFIQALPHGPESVNFWYGFLAVYVLCASVLPVWLLLQPRDYLASFFLYFAVIIGAIGMIFGSKLNLNSVPVWNSGITYLGMSPKALWPCLFTMVACGAVSGFHSLVSSGTTAKQIRCETDALPIGYGSMLLEGVVAVIAVGTILAASKDLVGKATPMVIFADGFGKFGELVGIKFAVGKRLGMIAVNTFLLTSLDTANRLCRYEIQELTDNKVGKMPASIIPVVVAMILVFAKTTGPNGQPIPAWSAIWPVFGASNQLVAAIALLAVAVWVIRGLKKPGKFLLIPFWFMLVTSVFALVIGIYNELQKPSQNWIFIVISAILIVLAAALVKQGTAAISKDKN